MEQLKQLLARLSLRQKITIGAAVLLVAGSLFWFSKWNKERDFKPLFTQLSAEDAGEVLARIRESGVEYRLGENGTSILVPSAKVAELRLQLASAGLPKSGRIGFELFDRTNFGATDFTEQVNFRRALEGELERSVASLAEVEQARVHITFPKDSIYTEAASGRQGKRAAEIETRRAPLAPECPRNLPSDCQRCRRTAARSGLCARHERQSPEPSQATRTTGRHGGLRRIHRVPAKARAEHDGEDRLHARSPARPGKVPRGRVHRLRLYQRRAERRDIRSDQIGHGHISAHRGRLQRRNHIRSARLRLQSSTAQFASGCRAWGR